MHYAFMAVSAIVPSLLLIWYFRNRDVHREPAGVIWRAFGLGVASVVPVLIIATPLGWLARQLSGGAMLQGFYAAFFEAAIPEELCKLLVIWLYASRHREFDEPMDGVVYGAVASLGFATLENILYTMSGGMGVAVARALTAVPAHAFWGAIMGYYVGQARFGSGGVQGLWLKAYLLPTLLHGLYDAPLLAMARMAGEGELPATLHGQSAAMIGGTFAVLLVSWIWTVRLTRRLRRQQLLAVASGEAPAPADAPAVTTAAVPPPAIPVVGWIGLLLGGLMASIGGLVLLGLVLAWSQGQIEAGELGDLVAGGAVLGLLPLALGLPLFRWGIRQRRG